MLRPTGQRPASPRQLVVRGAQKTMELELQLNYDAMRRFRQRTRPP